jgi:hypothetical protein
VVVTRHHRGDEFATSGAAVLAVLGARPGFLRGRVLQAAEEPALWSLVTEWVDVGSWRRALSASEVKMAATPVLAGAVDESTGWQVVETFEGGPPARASTDRLRPGPSDGDR